MRRVAHMLAERWGAGVFALGLGMFGLALAMGVTQGMAEAAEVVLPEADPKPTRVVQLREGLAGQHPRVLFTKADVPVLRARYKADAVARQRMEAYLDACKPFDQPKFQYDATDGQRQGLWRMPTLALHYVITEDPRSCDRAIEFLDQLTRLRFWEKGKEANSGMSAANIMIGAGLTYDLLYDELPEDLRQRVAEKLLFHARSMIHGGHLNKNNAIAYWQGDPANNHRWHRDAGLAIALLAVYEGQPEAQWAAEFLVDELALIHQWLPEDGSNHEGPGYLIFGLPHLVLAMQASDHALGTAYLRHDYFAHAPRFITHAMLPGGQNFMPYGDTSGAGFYFGALYAGPGVRGDAAGVALVDALRQSYPKGFDYGWMDVLWRDHTLAAKAQDAQPLPTAGRFDDLGLTFVRDGWGDDAVMAMFKCGPVGGRSLNAYREAQRPFKYINVAHGDPDANSFTLAVGRRIVAETSRYSDNKRSSSHNTVLINGYGQHPPGRGEGGKWMQPATGNHSMLGDARIVSWQQLDDDTLVIEGEAAGSYPARAGKRPAIERFRRLFAWKRGAYVLVLDEVRSGQPVEVTWLMQGPRLTPADDTGRFVLANKDASCGFMLVGDQPTQQAIGESTADNRGKPLGWQQLRAATGPVKAARFASVFMPWGGEPGVTLKTDAAGADVVVKHGGGEDRWRWTFAPGADEPAKLERP